MKGKNGFEPVQKKLKNYADEKEKEVDDLQNSRKVDWMHLLIKMFILPQLLRKITIHCLQENNV